MSLLDVFRAPPTEIPVPLVAGQAADAQFFQPGQCRRKYDQRDEYRQDPAYHARLSVN